MLKTSANSKLILFGEYSVLHGYHALGMGLPYHIHIKEGAISNSWKFIPSNGLILKEKDNEKLIQVCQLLQELYPMLTKPRELFIDSNIPIGVGLGSSGAITCALSRYGAYSSNIIDKNIILKNARILEHVYHGTSSGLDPHLAFEPALSFFKPTNDGLLRENLPNYKMSFVIGAFSRNGLHTKDIIEDLKKIEQHYFNHQMKKLGSYTLEAIDIIKHSKDNKLLGDICSMSQEVLHSLGLSTDAIDDILNYSKNNLNCLGGKISGAGKGGLFYLLFKNREDSFEALKKLKEYVNVKNYVLDLDLRVI